MRCRSLFALAARAFLFLLLSAPCVAAEGVPVQGATGFALGERSGCFVTAAGGVRCWGTNDRGKGGSGLLGLRSTAVADDVLGLLSGVRRVDVGISHACALMVDGTVRCWGANDSGQLGDGTTEDRLDPVVVPGLSGVVDIATGLRHTCAALSAGSVMCWGGNGHHQLGGIDVAGSSRPTAVPGLQGQVASSIDTRMNRTCGVFSGGALRCWGEVVRSAGTVPPQAAAAVFGGLESGVRAVSLSASFQCALLVDGALRCWGRNDEGQLGDGTTLLRGVPTAVNGLGGAVTMVATGDAHACAVVTGRGVLCWGGNRSGELGNGGFTSSPVPSPVPGLGTDVVEVRAGTSTCARSTSGAIRCWGSNDEGAVGDGDQVANPMPSDVRNLAGEVSGIALGERHACALDARGAVACWGTQEYSELPDGGAFGTRLQATPIPGLDSGFTSIAVGYGFSCASRPADGVWCWGSNSSGQVGDGTTTPRLRPIRMDGAATDPVQVVADSYHACALDRSGAVWCWGDNSLGRLGLGTVGFDATRPGRVLGLPTGRILRLSAGSGVTCANYESGEAWCWGTNFQGEVADGTYTNRPAPVRTTAFPEPILFRSGPCAISGDRTLRCIGLFNGSPTRPAVQETYPEAPLAFAARALACVLTADRKVRCAGPNQDGQSGQGIAPAWGDVPWGEVLGLGGPATSIAVSGRYACATLAAGGARCWGSNRDGLLGNGRGPIHVEPTALLARPPLVGVQVPSAPSSVSASFDGRELRVVTAAPATDGGAPVQFYEVTASPGNRTLRCYRAAPCEVIFPELPLGETYTFSAHAVNRAGRGASTTSAPVVARATQTIDFEPLPDRPFGSWAMAYAQASSGLQVRFSSATPSICAIQAPRRVVSVRVGLCTIVAEQPGDVGYAPAPPVQRSFSFLPTLPDAPSGATASIAATSATVRFIAPSNTGGTPLTGFRVVSMPEERVATCASGEPCAAQFDDLAPGVSYTFVVHAINAQGEGPPSAPTNAVVASAQGPTSSVRARPDRFEVAMRSRGVPLDVLGNDVLDRSRLQGGSLAIVLLPQSGIAAVDDRGTADASDDRLVYTEHWSRGATDRLRYRVCESPAVCAEADVDIELRPFEVGTQFDLVVDRASGFRDIAMKKATSLLGGRFDATPLVEPRSTVLRASADPSPLSPWDDAGAGVAFTLGELVAPSDTEREWSVLVDVPTPPPGIDLYFGMDADGNGRPSASEVTCIAIASSTRMRCDRPLRSAPGGRQMYWVMLHNRGETSRDVVVQDAAVPIIEGDGSLVVTGPTRVTNLEDLPLRVQWRDHRLVAGGNRVGYVRVRSDELPEARVPVLLRASDMAEVPLPLVNGEEASLALAPNGHHSRVFIDVPAGASELRVVMAATGLIDAYLARMPPPEPVADVPAIAPAPARAEALIVTGAPAREHVLTFAAPAAGRWYVVPRNAGGAAVDIELSAVVRGDFPRLRAGGFFNPGRAGSGLFVYPAGSEWAALWYTYLQDGQPTWYYLQGAAPGADGIWRGRVFRSHWFGLSNRLTAIGQATLAPGGVESATFSYSLDGETGSEALRHFGGGCPSIAGRRTNASGHWYNPQTAGSGYSVQLFPNYEFYLVFGYDLAGNARFFSAERQGLGGEQDTLRLDDLRGTCPLCVRNGDPQRERVGTFSRSIVNGTLTRVQLQASGGHGALVSWRADEAVEPLGALQGCPAD